MSDETDRAIVYDAYVERGIDGLYTAQLLDLLGCYARGTSEPAALQRLDAAIPAYYEWLRSHDEYTPIVNGPFSVRALQSLAAKPEGSPWSGVFFADDAAPMTDDDLDWALAILEWSYADLVAFARGLSPERLRQPLTSTAHQGVSPTDALQYALQLQVTCLSYITEPPGEIVQPLAAVGADIVAQLAWARDETLARLRATTDAQRILVHTIGGERWSLRKIARTSILIARVTTDVLAGGV